MSRHEDDSPTGSFRSVARKATRRRLVFATLTAAFVSLALGTVVIGAAIAGQTPSLRGGSLEDRNRPVSTAVQGAHFSNGKAVVPARFLSRFASQKRSGAISCRNKQNVIITGYTFVGIGNDTPAITISGCKNVIIAQNDFVNSAEPIYVFDSVNVIIDHNRYRNITGPHERNGSHRGNFTQWDHSIGGAITNNVGVGGDTEDIISIYSSGGSSSADPLLIAKNHFEGTTWTSSSGSGILVGDSGGSHVVVRDNVLLNPGQVGIGVAGGSDIRVSGNTILGEQRANSNVGIYVWGQNVACSRISVETNRVNFTKANGTPSSAWNAGNCGSLQKWSTNKFDAPLSSTALRVRL